MKKSKQECNCSECIKCCWRNPGWFGSLEEIKGASKLKKMSIKKFLYEYLIQEWYAGENEDITIPAPRRDFTRKADWASNEIFLNEEKIRNGKGFVRASWGHNLIQGYPCIFLTKDNKCSIHKSKPKECKTVFACSKKRGIKRENLVKYWGKHQDFLFTPPPIQEGE
jgi:Fe-S-cluster containining protein